MIYFMIGCRDRRRRRLYRFLLQYQQTKGQSTMGKRIKEFDRGFEAGKRVGHVEGYVEGYRDGDAGGTERERRHVVRTFCSSGFNSPYETLADVQKALKAAFDRCRSEGLRGALRAAGTLDWVIDGVQRGANYPTQIALLEMASLCASKAEERVNRINEVVVGMEVRAIQAETKEQLAADKAEELQKKIEDQQKETVKGLT